MFRLMFSKLKLDTHKIAHGLDMLESLNDLREIYKETKSVQTEANHTTEANHHRIAYEARQDRLRFSPTNPDFLGERIKMLLKDPSSSKPLTEKSKILVIGGTGYIGKFIVEGSAKSGHQTFALIRASSLSDPVKRKVVQNFKDLGVTLLNGDLSDKESLVKAIQHVDVVISTIGVSQILNQTNIISAIKESGKHIKRFLPSEFGNDVDRTEAIGPAKSKFRMKAEIRRAVEAEGVPYTYVINNCFDGYFLATLAQCETRLTSPPRDKVTIYGDGNAKAILNKEEDIAAYTMRAVDDPRTLNKTVYINPPKNIVSQNDIVAFWESKIGETLEKTYVSEEELLEKISESPHPLGLLLALNHAIFVKGVQTCFTIEPSFGVEASQLYPDVKYTSVDEYLSQFV